MLNSKRVLPAPIFAQRVASNARIAVSLLNLLGKEDETAKRFSALAIGILASQTQQFAKKVVANLKSAELLVSCLQNVYAPNTILNGAQVKSSPIRPACPNIFQAIAHIVEKDEIFAKAVAETRCGCRLVEIVRGLKEIRNGKQQKELSRMKSNVLFAIGALVTKVQEFADEIATQVFPFSIFGS